MKTLYRLLPAQFRTPEGERLVRYGVFGVLTTLVNLGLFWLLFRGLGWNENLSNAVAIVCAVAFAYVTNKRYVFRARSGSLKALAREALAFFAGRAVTMLLEFGGVLLLVSLLGFSDLWVKPALTVLVILLNYLFSRFLVFR